MTAFHKKTWELLEEFFSTNLVKYRRFYRKFYCKNIRNYDNKFDRYDRLHVVSRLSGYGVSVYIYMYLFQTESERIKGLVTNYGEGGHVKFDPYEKGGGGRKKFKPC